MPRKSKLAGKKTYQPKKKGQMKRRPKKSGQIRGQGGQTIKYNNSLVSYHRARKTLLNATFFSAGSPGIAAAINPTVASMPDFGNYTSLFTHYMINSFSITFKWVDNDLQQGVDLTSVRQPVLNIGFNDDSNVAAVTQALVGEKRNMVQHTFTPEKSVFTYTFYPKTVSPVFLSNLTSGYKANPKQFIDCDYSAVPHYGVVVWAEQIPVGTQINVDYHYDVTFKHQK